MDKDGSAGDPDEVGAQGKQTKMFKGFWDTFFFGQ